MATLTFVHHREAVEALERRLREDLLTAKFTGKPLVSIDGRFRIDRYLDHGASSVVCEAHDNKMGRRIALKLFPGLADDALARAVKQEAQHLAGVAHANIVHVYDYDVLALPGDCRCFFVVMELGVSLKKWLETAPGQEAILATFGGIGQGLAAIHAAGFVHRDVKPENVVLVGGIPKIVDFGLAHTPTTGAAATATRVVGTLRYMSPEALRGERQTACSDQFSFAAALWKTLCRELPYPETDDPKLRRPTVAPKVPLPKAVERALRKALDPLPGLRFPDVPALLAALQVASPQQTATPAEPVRASGTGRMPTLGVDPESTTELRRPPRRSAAPWLMVPMAGVLSVGGVLTAMGFWSDDGAVEEDAEFVEEKEIAAPGVAPGAGCPNTGALVGVWQFRTSATWAENPGTIGTNAAYDLNIRGDGTLCGLDVELRKLSDSEPRSDRRRVQLVAALPFAGSFSGEFAPIRTGEAAAENSYTFTLVVDSDRMYGDFHATNAKGARFSGVLQGGRANGQAITAEARLPCTVLCGARCLGAAATATCRQACASDAWAEMPCTAPDATAIIGPPKPSGCNAATTNATAYAGKWLVLARDRKTAAARTYEIELKADGCALNVVSARESDGDELTGTGRIDRSGLWRLDLTSGRGRTRLDHTWSLIGHDPAFGNFSAKHKETEYATGVIAAYRR